ncbi:LytR/AlgR family response regulator transcription factor [Pararhodonellum marinum]|uniref:LytR/AlgR family response regulator transcription factor n=1 Tax=Pararhodonellum marinum TaxID=2755358 RepID=UPI00188FBCAB|nr:LytTR family transcriptional regulator DNA-binding domain-containing protein [Pararhodonellum marinum]
MKKVLIIDDEPLATALVEEYLEDHEDLEILKICHNGFEGLKAIQELQPDLVFLDVQMPKINGFELLELLDSSPAVIFTTAFDQYAVKAFDAFAVDYLLKPFSKQRFDQAIDRFHQQTSQIPSPESPKEDIMPADRIVLKMNQSIKIIPFSEIKYLEANDDYINIYTAEGKFLKNKPLKYFDKIMDPQSFVRVHRSYLVKVSEITKIEAYEKGKHIVRLRTGEKIPVSKTGYVQLKELLGI